jgi:hypothetical protein
MKSNLLGRLRQLDPMRLLVLGYASYVFIGWVLLCLPVCQRAHAVGVLEDVWKCFIGLKKQITLTSKIILACTLWIALIGTFLFAIDEPTCHSLPPGERWMTALFQVGSASTTVGFDTLPIGGLSASSLFLLTVIMVIGASPSGTGGGLKTTTFTALWAVMKSVIDRREKNVFLGRHLRIGARGENAAGGSDVRVCFRVGHGRAEPRNYEQSDRVGQAHRDRADVRGARGAGRAGFCRISTAQGDAGDRARTGGCGDLSGASNLAPHNGLR